MIKLRPEARLITQLNNNREQRYADRDVIISQIGLTTLMACAGGMKNVHTVRNTEGEPCGVLLWLGTGRATEVVLDYDDTYSLRRYRIITRGKDDGQIVTESEFSNVYCDQLSDLVYEISCWK